MGGMGRDVVPGRQFHQSSVGGDLFSLALSLCAAANVGYDIQKGDSLTFEPGNWRTLGI